MIPGMVKLSFALLLLCVPVFSQPKYETEKAYVLRRCAEYFGPAVDARLNLYEANSFYVLQAGFDSKNRLEQLRVVPKYSFDEDHPEWEESEAFEYLSWVQYQNLLTRMDLIKSRGKLVAPAHSPSVVTNMTAWEASMYENAKLTTGVLVDIREPDDARTRIRLFRLEFGKKARKKTQPWKPIPFPSSLNREAKVLNEKIKYPLLILNSRDLM